ncbi:MAG: ribonuclease Z [Gemmatimonadaceae bacterium]
MRLTTVGTGTAAPSPRRVQSATLIEAEHVRLLVDCGSGAVFRMAELGIAWQELTHVALTHFHADHTNDLANLVFAWRYGMQPPRSAPIEIIGPAGTEALVARMAEAFGASLLTSVPLRFTDIGPGEQLSLGGGCEIGACKVPHTDESMAYSVTGEERRVVVSGDTGFDPAFSAWAYGCDVLVLECSLPDELAIPTHLTPRQCGDVAAIARPSLLALTHFYPPVEAVDIEAQVAERFDGRMVRAEDGWMIDFEET